MSTFWMSAFVDRASTSYAAAVAHLGRLTGWQLSGSRGENNEFASLLPPDGDPFLKVQRLIDGASRIHLDLHASDPAAATATAIDHGAELLADHGYRVLRSPGGFVFCIVDQQAHRRPAATRWPATARWESHAAILDQVCLDIPADRWDSEQQFWSGVTGWTLRPVGGEFVRLHQPALPIKLLLQRRDDSDGPTRAHLDWASDHRQAEIDRHVQAGSELVRRYPGWTVMDGPSGVYCITGRRPD